jgi:CheY-like chemotaxis protein
MMIGSLLTSVGLEVVTAENGKGALEAVRTEAPDAVLLDLIMPMMDGMTFLQKLRANPLHKGLPVIVLTAKELSRAEQKALADMASGVMLKGPDIAAELIDALGSMFTLTPVDEEAD